MRDLESDFSRFHRVDDVWAMPAPRFFAFAYRIASYGGMLARRIEAANAADQPAADTAAAAAAAVAVRGGEPAVARRDPRSREGLMPMSSKTRQTARVVPLAALALSAPGVIERVKATPAPPTSEQT
jgi:hypothetical protein